MGTQVEKNIIDFLLGHFRQFPGMYLGRNHISLLSSFVTGYMISLQQNGFDISSDPFFGNENSGFFKWYQKRKEYELCPGFPDLLNECDNSETDALELFFNLLEEYNSEVKQRK